MALTRSIFIIENYSDRGPRIKTGHHWNLSTVPRWSLGTFYFSYQNDAGTCSTRGQRYH